MSIVVLFLLSYFEILRPLGWWNITFQFLVQIWRYCIRVGFFYMNLGANQFLMSALIEVLHFILASKLVVLTCGSDLCSLFDRWMSLSLNNFNLAQTQWVFDTIENVWWNNIGLLCANLRISSLPHCNIFGFLFLISC